MFPPEYEAVRAARMAIVGNPEQVGDEIAKQLRETSASYFAARFAFGDLALGETLESAEMFAREVIPAVRTGL